MNDNILAEKSIREIFVSGNGCCYEVPVYQRNYAWEKDEIDNLVQDVLDSMQKSLSKPYYIGTLVTFNKGENVFEVIDGQQRLTTIRLILNVLNVEIKNPLKYRARKKSDTTLKHLADLKQVDEYDNGIINGLEFARKAIDEKVGSGGGFKDYFLDNVHIIHYQVPKDIDLNHYFEVMNSRGEQLEKHEIVKAQLMQKLSDGGAQSTFNKIWQACSQMPLYVQQTDEFEKEKLFSGKLDSFLPNDFDQIASISDKSTDGKLSIKEILGTKELTKLDHSKDIKDTFQPIIDFPNFLLIVLKIMRIKHQDFDPQDFKLDDKELLDEFRKADFDNNSVKEFGYLLIKCKFLLDNYIVHHANEDDTAKNNPWKLQILRKNSQNKPAAENLTADKPLQDSLVHLLSMFEVSFTPRQRKNYLFYILLYLNDLPTINIAEYHNFVETLADWYCDKIYLDHQNLNEKNTPLPGSFDEAVLHDNKLYFGDYAPHTTDDFFSIYGDGTTKTRGIPLFVFNYCDYKIWKFYQNSLRGEKLSEKSQERRNFFSELGCNDFGLDIFNEFYFSRTRRSLELFYPQANADGKDGHLIEHQINCFGNFAMIGSAINSSGSNWDPKTKLSHYIDDGSGKVNKVSVASLKFAIMMQICKDHGKWDFSEITEHQTKMAVLMLK